MERMGWSTVSRDGERGDFTQRLGSGSRFREGSLLLDQRIKARAAELHGEPSDSRSPWAPSKRRFS